MRKFLWLAGVACFLSAEVAMAMELKSSDFSAGSLIPRDFTCEGRDVSPALAWEGAPQGTASFALICDDPDAPMGTWVHWVIFNIPASAHQLASGVPDTEVLSDSTRQGINDSQMTGYGGPCPPPGKAHRYYFKLYALDAMLPLSGRVTKEKLLAAMQGHILAQAQTMGTYRRK